MKNFMDEDFLLSTEAARTLYHEVAERLPIIDYHCHISPEEIARDRIFENITQICTAAHADAYKTFILTACAKHYVQHNWVMQIRFGCLRDNNRECTDGE